MRETSEREVLDSDVSANESEVFWVDFLRGLVRRGFEGVQLVTSDALEGLEGTIQ